MARPAAATWTARGRATATSDRPGSGGRRVSGAERRRQLEEARRARRAGRPSPLSLVGGDPLGIGRAEDPDGRGLHRPNRRLLYMLVGVLVAVVAVRLVTHGGGITAGPSLARSCTQPAFAAGPTTVSAGETFQVALTGPVDGTYAVYLDVAALGGADGSVRTPSPGAAVGQTQVLTTLAGLPNCLQRREVALDPVRPGAHVLTLFRGGALVATVPITVS